MQFFTKTLAVATIGMLLATNAQANNIYLGARAGQLAMDIDNFAIETDKPTYYGFYGGYNFGHGISVESEYLKTEKFGAKNSSIDNIKLEAMGVYGVYRMPIPSQENIYLKGKIGTSQVTIETDLINKKGESKGFGFGVGVGADISDNLAVEAEYSQLPDIDDMKIQQLNIAGHMKF